MVSLRVNRLYKEIKRIGDGTSLLLFFGLMFLILCYPLEYTIQTARAQPIQENYSTFLPNEEFAISSLNGSISFASGGSYETATLENGTWHFEGLALNSYTFNLSARGAPPGGIVTGRDVIPYLNDNGAFSASTQNCNVTIRAFEPLSTYYPHSGWLNYTIIGIGEQTFDLHFPSKNFFWNITIDGEFETQNGTGSENKLIKIVGSKNEVAIHYDSMGTIRDLDDNNPNFPWLPILIAIILTIVLAWVILTKRRNAKSTVV